MKTHKRIKFFTFYGCLEEGKRRDNSPAADTKVDYIVSVLNRVGYGVDIISRASSAESYFLPASINTKGENTYRYFASFGLSKSFFRLFYRWFLELQFFFWCLFNLKLGEQVIVYHSLGYDATFLKLHKLKSIHIIGEIEEIYQDVRKVSKRCADNEYKFIDVCDKYIFPTQLLDKKMNRQNKPSIIIHGVYFIEPIVESKFTDGKIHVVYGGTLDPAKGGGIAAAAAAEFLSENYHIHICGFGDPSQIISIIQEVKKKSKAQITFEGELKGNEYKRFIQKCHIGLSTQNPNATFNDTSFPSKIFVYLSNGLKVVSIRIPVVVQSFVANNLFFYDRQTPEMIANAIIRASNETFSDNNILNYLDKNFSVELKNLLETGL